MTRKGEVGPRLIHGASRGNDPTYTTWEHMRRRCNNERGRKYPLYGGRGIRVCERWNDYRAFLADMGPRPHGTTIDRIDSDGHYEPNNCRWATPGMQTRNRRDRLGALPSVLLRQIWIRTRRRNDGSKQAIADAFGVTYATAHKIGTRRSAVDAVRDLCGKEAP